MFINFVIADLDKRKIPPYFATANSFETSYNFKKLVTSS